MAAAAGSPDRQRLADLSQFQQPGSVDFTAGEGGMLRAVLTHRSGSMAEVYLLGAHVTKFRSACGRDVIYVSPTAVYEEGKAIRGGIPVCFPQFSDVGQLPAHGFVRNRCWKVAAASCSEGLVSLTFRISANDTSRAAFPHEWSMEYVVELYDTHLTTTISLTNDNSTAGLPFTFTGALHTYYNVSDVTNARAVGLNGSQYYDNVTGRDMKEEPAENTRLAITEETDRIYLNVGTLTDGKLELHDEGCPGKIIIEPTGFPDAVWWNPWVEKTKKLKDMPDEDYHKFVCIETATICSIDPLQQPEVKPGQTWTGVQTIRVGK